MSRVTVQRADGAAAARQLLLIGAVQVLAMAAWFAASAVGPVLREEWAMGRVGEALLTSGVQLGFVVGALASAATSLPDRVYPPRLMALGALVASVTTLGVATVATGVVAAVWLRVATGIALALVYPVGMKLAVSWFDDRRGLAVSVVVGTLTLGSILPRLVSGSLGSAWRETLVVSAALALAAAVVGLRIEVGPLVQRSTGFEPRVLLGIMRERAPRLANLGYLGHMWELYALWAWLPAYLTASIAARGDDPSAGTVGLITFLALGACGAAGCLLAGWLGDRLGLAPTAAVAMIISGGCCLLAAAAYGAPLVLLVPLLLVWGASVIADSAMFSASLGTVVDRRYVGTALTLQTALGFLLSIVSIQLVPVVAAAAGWPLAVAMLGAGPLLGAVAMLRLSPLMAARA